jgi:hypothetical protein
MLIPAHVTSKLNLLIFIISRLSKTKNIILNYKKQQQMKATIFLILAISFSVFAGKLPLENGLFFKFIYKKDPRKLIIFVR